MTEPTDPIPPAPSGGGLTCEFCKCRLSSTGDVLRRSPEARAMIDLDDDNAKLRAKIDTLTADVTRLTGELETAKADAPVPAGGGDRW